MRESYISIIEGNIVKTRSDSFLITKTCILCDSNGCPVAIWDQEHLLLLFPALLYCIHQPMATQYDQITHDIPTKMDMEILLEQLDADPYQGKLLLGKEEIALYDTYNLNCKESPAKHLIVLPGFGEEAIKGNPAGALTAFRNFCKSQLGQRMKVGMPFKMAVLKQKRLLGTLVTVDLFDAYITYRLMSGKEEEVLLPSTNLVTLTFEDIDNGVDFVTGAAQKIMPFELLTKYALTKTTHAFFNNSEEDWNYGPEYLCFAPGVSIIKLAPPSEPMGWEYGIIEEDKTMGWYPPSFVS